MGRLQDALATFRDFVVDGVATSGIYNPKKSDIRFYETEVNAAIDALQAAQGSGALAFDTLARLTAFVAAPVNAAAFVFNDVSTSNGIYRNTGTATAAVWTFVSGLIWGNIAPLQIGTVTYGGAIAATITGPASAPMLNLTLPAPGPAPFTQPAPWAASTPYTATAPASCVVVGGQTYVCTTAHTSGASFDATKWIVIASAGTLLRTGPGAPGAGIGSPGDWWIDNVAYVLYGPKTTSWPAAGLSLVSLISPVPWAPGAAYVVASLGAAASCVSFANGTYLCTTAHVAGATFDASKWSVLAGPGPTGPSAFAGTSVTSNSIGTGPLTFTTQAGLAYAAGMRVRLAADANDWVEGVVTAYSGTTLTIAADAFAGSGAFASWSIGIAGNRGATGGVGPAGASSANVDSKTSIARTITELRDSANSFLEGRTWDGRVAKSLFKKRATYTVRRDGLGNRQICVGDAYGETQLTFTGENYEPELLRGGMILFTTTRRGRPEKWLMSEDGSNQILAWNIVCEHWQVTGQSNTLGVATTTAENVALTTTNQTPGAFMFQALRPDGTAASSPRAHQDTYTVNNDYTLRVDRITGIEPLRENAFDQGSSHYYAETPCSGFAAQYMKGADPSQRFLIDIHGRGGAPWSAQAAINNGSSAVYIAPGSAHFANGQALQRLGRKYVEAAGWDYFRAGLLDFHGEADASTASGTTAAQYTQFQKDKLAAYNGLSKTPSRFHRSKRMYTRQASETAGTGYANSFAIACANAQAALDEPRIICFSAAYPYPYCGDAVHQSNVGNRALGEMGGKWARRVEKEGFVHKPFLFTSAKMVSSTVCRLTFNVPVGALVLDTTTFTLRTNYGFEYSDGSSSGITITGVALTSGSTNQVDITLSGNPLAQTAPVIAYAKTSKVSGWSGTLLGNGAYGNLRDGDAEVGVLSGATLWNWALHWQAGITS